MAEVIYYALAIIVIIAASHIGTRLVDMVSAKCINALRFRMNELSEEEKKHAKES